MIKIKNWMLYKKIITLALPVALENIVNSSISFLDNFMVGRNIPELGLGTNAVAALGISNQLFFLYIVMLFGIFTGSGILSAQFFGNKDYVKLKKITTFMLVCSIIISIPFIIIGIFNPEMIISIFTDNKSVLELAKTYYKISIISYPISGISLALTMQIRVLNLTKLPFYSSCVGLVVNFILNLLLIPVYGVRGAAIATLIAKIISLSYLIYIIYIKKLNILDNLKNMFIIDIPIIKNIFILSFATFIQEFLWVLGTNYKSAIIGKIGALELASIVTATTITSINFSVFSGISNSTSILIGNYLGSNEKEKAEKTASISIKLMIILGIFLSIFLAMISPFILHLMKTEENLRYITQNILLIECIVITFKALNLLLIVGILRSGGDIFYPMVIDITGMWLISIPLTLFGSYMGYNIYIIYIFTTIYEFYALIFAMYRYYKKIWLKRLID